MKKAAVFDLDGTIVKGTSGIRFARFLIRRNIIKIRMNNLIPSLIAVYDFIRKNLINSYIEIDKVWGNSIKGLREEVLNEQARQYARLEHRYMRESMLEKIKYHKENNHVLILFSATPHELVHFIGEELGFDIIRGMRVKTEKGVYTGEVKKPYMIGEGRLQVLKKIAKKNNIDIAESYAYGNCVSDEPVLEASGHPVAVHPNYFLKKTAERKGWKIIE